MNSQRVCHRTIPNPDKYCSIWDEIVGRCNQCVPGYYVDASDNRCHPSCDASCAVDGCRLSRCYKCPRPDFQSPVKRGCVQTLSTNCMGASIKLDNNKNSYWLCNQCILAFSVNRDTNDCERSTSSYDSSCLIDSEKKGCVRCNESNFVVSPTGCTTGKCTSNALFKLEGGDNFAVCPLEDENRILCNAGFYLKKGKFNGKRALGCVRFDSDSSEFTATTQPIDWENNVSEVSTKYSTNNQIRSIFPFSCKEGKAVRESGDNTNNPDYSCVTDGTPFANCRKVSRADESSLRKPFARLLQSATVSMNCIECRAGFSLYVIDGYVGCSRPGQNLDQVKSEYSRWMQS